MLRHCLVAERAVDLSVFDLSDSSLAHRGQDVSEDPKAFAADYRRSMRALSILGLTIGDRKLMLEATSQMVALSEEDWPEAFRLAKEVAANVDKKVHAFPPKIFSGLFLSAEDRIVTRMLNLEARRECALAALAIEQYRIQHKGALPEQLNALVQEVLPKVPKDPFDGQPLRYRRSAKGYVVYSVGADLQDDGGVQQIRSSSSSKGDEVFTVERSE